MADYTPVAAQGKLPPQMTLADMVNLAGGIQQYQQKAATNPLALQQQQYQTQTASQEARKGELGLGVEEQKAKERPLLQQFFSDPSRYTTDGQYDAKKALAGISAIAPLTGPDYLKSLAGTMQAQSSESEAATKAQQAAVGLNTDQLKNLQAHQQNSSRNLLNLLQKDNITPEDIQNHVQTTMQNAGASKEAIQQELGNLPTSGTQAQLKAFIAKHATNSLAAEAQLEKLFPPATAVNTGGKIKFVQLGNEALTNVKPGTVVGPSLETTLAPTVVTSETGAPKIIGGGKDVTSPNAVINQTQDLNVSTVPPPKTKIKSNVEPNLNAAFESKGGLKRAPDETYDAYKARTAELSALPSQANTAMNAGNPASIPNLQNLNDKVLNLLNDKDVDVGPVASAIANKTGGVSLTPKQQIIQKYLEQRIRQEGARSNDDQDSQRRAFGSFGTDKAALQEIIYNDKGILAAKQLFNQGVLKAQGNPNSPNLGAINQFKNNYTDLTSDPNLLHLIGVVGNKSMEQLSVTDKQHLKKMFGSMNVNDIQSLFDKKTKLENLVKGQQ